VRTLGASANEPAPAEYGHLRPDLH
jgi:hypothetical protein